MDRCVHSTSVHDGCPIAQGSTKHLQESYSHLLPLPTSPWPKAESCALSALQSFWVRLRTEAWVSLIRTLSLMGAFAVHFDRHGSRLVMTRC